MNGKTRANKPDKIGILCIAQIWCGGVTTRLPLRVVPCAEKMNRLANVKNREQCILQGASMGLGPPH
jgi:hypothetical protein